jgi:hypothetical protein
VLRGWLGLATLTTVSTSVHRANVSALLRVLDLGAVRLALLRDRAVPLDLALAVVSEVFMEALGRLLACERVRAVSSGRRNAESVSLIRWIMCAWLQAQRGKGGARQARDALRWTWGVTLRVVWCGVVWRGVVWGGVCTHPSLRRRPRCA